MYHNYIWWQKELILFQIYLVYAERSLADFHSSSTRTGIFSTIISAAANEGPDEILCFPAGQHYLLTFLTRLSSISQKSMCLYANFSEKGCLYIAMYANFSKRECRPAGKHISPRPSSATEIVGNCLPVSQTSHFSQNHLSKSNNLDIFALEANTLF